MKNDLFVVEFQERTRKFTTMKTKLFLHNYVNSQGKQQIVLAVSINGKRKRIYTGFFIAQSDWDKKRERPKDSKSDLSIIIDNIIAKTTDIRTFYFLSQKELSLDIFLEEFHQKSPSYDFNSFMISRIEETITNPNTLKKHRSIHKKLKEYKEKIPFILNYFSNFSLP